jgi:hypothetical protein
MVKKTAFIAAMFLALYLPMKAQTEKFLIAGKLGFSFSSDNPVSYPDMVSASKNKTVSFSGAPVFGYFFTKNIMAGIDFEFSTEKTDSPEGVFGITKSSSITLNPLIRVYFNSPFFTEVSFTWGTSTSVYEFPYQVPVEELKLDSKTLGCGAGLGYDIKLAEKVSLEPLIYYRWNTYKTDKVDVKSNQSHLFINLGLVFKI